MYFRSHHGCKIARVIRKKALKLGLRWLLSLCLTIGNASTATALSVTGFLADPIGLDSSSRRISESLDRSLRQLAAIQEETDESINHYLDRIAEIVADFNEQVNSGIADIDALIARAVADAERLEKTIYRDAVDLIWRAHCSAEEVFNGTLQRSLADAINSIRRSDPSVRLFGLKIVETEIKPIDVPDPDVAYRAVKKEYLIRLNVISGQDDPYFLVSTYSNLARLARLTRCHYLGLSAGDLFVRDFYEFERLAAPWKNLVDL